MIKPGVVTSCQCHVIFKMLLIGPGWSNTFVWLVDSTTLLTPGFRWTLLPPGLTNQNRSISIFHMENRIDSIFHVENRNWSILIGQSVSCQVSDWLTFLHMNLRYLKNPPQIYLVSDWLSVLNDLFIHGRWIVRARNTNTSFHWRSNGIRYFYWLLKRFFKTKTFILWVVEGGGRVGGWVVVVVGGST